MGEMNTGFEVLQRFTNNWIRTRVFKKRRVKPMILSYFVTFRCNLRCGYCDYTDPMYREKYPEIDTDHAIRLLEICRAGIPSLAISGGEPLLRDDIIEILSAARHLNYKPITLFTNSLLLPEREEVLDYVDFLQISLDTADNVTDKGTITDHRSVTEMVKENVRKYAKMQRKKNFKINVNCVVCENHINDVQGVLDFARNNNVRFTLAPRLINEKPDAALVGNKRYEDLIKGIIATKHEDRTVMDTFSYLSHIRLFLPFRCYPWLTPRIYPNGELLYPCPVLNYSAYNVPETGSWDKLEDIIIKNHGAHIDCNKKCFLPCYLAVSTLLSDVFTSLKELRRL
jgi:MoaA/NifB/PqqE/SkfB family radical SAM enzyme